MKLKIEGYIIEINAEDSLSGEKGKNCTLDFLHELLLVYQVAAEAKYADTYLNNYYEKEADKIRTCLETNNYYGG